MVHLAFNVTSDIELKKIKRKLKKKNYGYTLQTTLVLWIQENIFSIYFSQRNFSIRKKEVLLVHTFLFTLLCSSSLFDWQTLWGCQLIGTSLNRVTNILILFGIINW